MTETQPLFDFLPSKREDFMVPQAIFLRWSQAQQFAYCARRDRDSLLDPLISDDEREIYTQRAALYER